MLGTPGAPDITIDSGYSAWAAINGVVGGPADDDDRDSISNFLEFALVSPPLTRSSHLLPVGQAENVEIDGVTDTYLMFTFRRNLNAPNLNYSVESSSDLQTWENTDQMILFSSTPNGDGSEAVTYRSAVPISNSSSLYIRLLVTD